MTLFEKPLEELKSFFNLKDPLEKSMESEKEEEKKKEEEEKKKEEEKAEKSLDVNAFFAKTEDFFKSIQTKIDGALGELSKSMEVNNDKTAKSFEKLVKSLEEVTQAAAKAIDETKAEFAKSLEDIKADFDTRLKKLEDVPKMKKSVEAIERFKNQESNEEELSKSVITNRIAALFKKGVISDHDVMFWDANKKLGMKVLPEHIQKAIREYKD